LHFLKNPPGKVDAHRCDHHHRKGPGVSGTAAVETPGHLSPRGAAGADGNERLTAITGAFLLVLFAVEGVTILSLSSLLYWHYFVGFLLVGPACVKIGSTGYRFARYYTGSPAYVRKGPPMILLRVLGPFVVLTSCAVIGTGVALGFGRDTRVAGLPMLLLHKGFFVLWAGAMTIHVLAYVWRLPALVTADFRAGRGSRARAAAAAVGGRALRWSLTAAGLGGGLALALAFAHLASSWR
jgi:hypothetical protein